MIPPDKSSEMNSFHEIERLTQEIRESCIDSESKIEKIESFFVWPGTRREMKDWAAQHIHLCKELEHKITEMVIDGQEVPPETLEALREGEKIVHSLANKISYSEFLQAILPDRPYADPSKLLSQRGASSEEIPPMLEEWALNFGLLNSLYNQTQSEETKKLIRFLMINYLAKSAYLTTNPRISLTDVDLYRNMLQIGLFAFEGSYHRDAITSIPMAWLLGIDRLAGDKSLDSNNLVPLDTIDIQALYDLEFVQAPDISDRDRVVDLLAEQFEKHLDHFADVEIEFPVLIDITDQMEGYLATYGDPEKIEAFKRKKEEVADQLKIILELAAKRIKEKHPENDKIQDEIEKYLATTTIVVSRGQITDEIGVLAIHQDILCRKFRGNLRYGSEKIKAWVGHTGIAVGSVNFRKFAAEFCAGSGPLVGKEKIVTYSVPGGKRGITFYCEPQELLETQFFQTLDAIANGNRGAAPLQDLDLQELPPIGLGQRLLAHMTVQMIRALFGKISKERWEEMQRDPAMQELMQITLLRIQHHISKAIHDVDNFTKFFQAIDLVHSDLTAILVAAHPWDPGSFDQRYAEFVAPILPKDSQANTIEPVYVGIGKSAMNLFSGVNAAILQTNPNPVRVCAPHSYYEEAIIVGSTLTIEQALQRDDIEKIDLYTCEFYHNIDINPNHTRYQKANLADDIQAILDKNGDNPLTVAIDATIDFTQSRDLRDLLERFKGPIEEGRLNIVVFRSGQKFDMLGLDNYYGAPFFVINNGDPKWDYFKQLKTGSAFHTDDLSLQFFNWMGDAGFALSEEYKAQIFANTRAILNVVPEGLMPAPGKDCCIASFDEDVLTPFIDIKLDLENPRQKDVLQRWARARFVEIFAEERKLVYTRDSFGFPCPNIAWIDPKIRITSGIDPSDAPIFQRYFNELEAKIAEIKPNP